MLRPPAGRGRAERVRRRLNTELAPPAATKQFHGLGAASLAGSEVITEGIPVASQPPPPMAFGTRSGVALKSQAGSAGSKMRVLIC